MSGKNKGLGKAEILCAHAEHWLHCCLGMGEWGKESTSHELLFSPMRIASDAELLYPHVCYPPLDMWILYNKETKLEKEIDHTSHQNSHNTHLLKSLKHFIQNISNGIRYHLC